MPRTPPERRPGPVIGQRGQAAVSFVAVVPLLLAACLLVAQVAVVGYSAWSAASAARAGARALLIGAPAEPAVHRALPGALSGRADVRVDRERGEVGVELASPRLLPLLPRVAVGGSAALPAERGADD